MTNIDRIIEMINEQLEKGSAAWLILLGSVFALACLFFFISIRSRRKRSIESKNYTIFCIPVIIWSGLLFSGPLFDIDNSEGTWIYFGIFAAKLLIPPFLMLHIWSQVSYKRITAGVYTFWLAAPSFLIVAFASKVVDPTAITGLENVFAAQISVFELISNLYFVIVLIKAYILCAGVFYQMPAHMQQSAHNMIIAITAIFAAQVAPLYFSFPENIVILFSAASYIIAMYTLYSAFYIANSSNVIVTSRDFVFSALSTTVITLSLKGNILDWNHKGKDGCFPLQDPIYLEPYKEYRKRILDTMNGTISSHDENIICLKKDGIEYHLLFTWHHIEHQGRKFGYLVEISEITKIYSSLRYIEEIAYYDNLTSLYNRNAYIEEVKKAARAENIPMAIIVGDINRLKKINDTYGHLHGDSLIMTITKAIKENAPKRAFIARIGGDEIVLLLRNSGRQEAEDFISDVEETLSKIKDPVIGTPSISWGHSIMFDAKENYNDVFLVADSIMYEAKKKAYEMSLSGVI